VLLYLGGVVMCGRYRNMSVERGRRQKVKFLGSEREGEGGDYLMQVDYNVSRALPAKSKRVENVG
jgi:hypothetical protein